MKTRLAALALASLALACADNGASIQPFAICAPPDAVACVFEDTCDAHHMGPLYKDPTAAQLIVFLQVNNQLPNNEDISAGRLNTNDAYVQEYEVEYEGAASGTSAGKTQGVAPAGGSTIVGLVLTTPAGAAGQVLAKMRLKGKLADQSEFETAAYEAPIIITPVPPPACPTGEVLKGTCPGNLGQIPLGVECEAPPTTPVP